MKKNRDKSRGWKSGASGGWSADNPILKKAMNVAASRHRQGDLDGAEEALNEVLARDPKHIEATTLLAMIATQRGDHLRSEKLAREALKRDKRQPAAWFVIATALMAQGKGEQARKACQSLLKLQPGHPAASQMLARLDGS